MRLFFITTTFRLRPLKFWTRAPASMPTLCEEAIYIMCEYIQDALIMAKASMVRKDHGNMVHSLKVLQTLRSEYCDTEVERTTLIKRLVALLY